MIRNSHNNFLVRIDPFADDESDPKEVESWISESSINTQVPRNIVWTNSIGNTSFIYSP